jgi:superfamily I DNA/RNA helicase
VNVQDWRPSGIDDLEPQAWRALRETTCTCVIAGPGAGKTEFLAQRAVYLLETGLCPHPRRVLAISFKSDAADNLATRVRKRCPSELAGRFVSLTFDAFTKGLVDRFLLTIPAEWRPTRPYDVAFPKRREIADFLDLTRLGARPEWQSELAALSAETFESSCVGPRRLPLVPREPATAIEYAMGLWWTDQLRRRARSSMTFVGLNRLAELLLRANPRILRALRATYPFVFVDEFQDTTYAQYDFLRAVFADDRITVTAVGDNKQRIMGWAGACTNAFVDFESQFRAVRIALHFNFRSSADLVRIQHVVARAIDADAVPVEARTLRDVDGEVAQVWTSSLKAAEAAFLAQWMTQDMAARGRSPRDYAILVRQKADEYEQDLRGEFLRFGLRMRNESRAIGRTTLQDLLADDLCRLLLAVLRASATRQAPDSWRLASSSIEALRGVDPDDEVACQTVDSELTALMSELRTKMASPPNPSQSNELLDRVLMFLDLRAIARNFAAYATGDLLAIIVEACKLHLSACAHQASTWSSCLDAFEGVGQIPLMTVHKSKGLEYDTIVFVGLDDQAWWSHNPRNSEGLATFFVALSRAKQRAIFAFCRERGRRQRIADLYQLLRDAGVPEVAI